MEFQGPNYSKNILALPDLWMTTLFNCRLKFLYLCSLHNFLGFVDFFVRNCGCRIRNVGTDPSLVAMIDGIAWLVERSLYGLQWYIESYRFLQVSVMKIVSTPSYLG
jgi:hypothetical protein